MSNALLKNDLYKSSGFFWEIEEFEYVNWHNVSGPLCLTCKTEMDISPEFPVFLDSEGEPAYDESWTGVAHCSSCNKDFKIDTNLVKLKTKVARQYMAKQRENYEVHFLDEPPTQLKAKEENEKYFVSVKFQERDGKKQGVVYFGEKTKKQTKKDYAQVFIDFESEQMRADKNNKHPNAIAKLVKTVFPGTGNKVKFEK